MKMKIRIPKTKLWKIPHFIIYNKVESTLHKVGNYQIKSIISRTSADRLDYKMQPLQELSEGRISRKGNDNILTDTWEMLNSIEYRVEDKQKLQLFNPNDYHKFHVEGTKKMPSRDYFGYTDDDISEIEKMFYDAMMSLFGKWEAELRFGPKDELNYP